MLARVVNYVAKVVLFIRGLRALDSDKALEDLRSWFESTLGAHVLAAEQAILNQLLPGLFGYDLLQLSLQSESLFGSSPIHHKVKMGIAQTDSGDFTGKATQLPFETDSMDVVLLHHLLEYYDSPQQILREAGRIALPSGHVVIIGFNPLSLWGAYRPIGQVRSLAPWCGRFIRPGRLMDWLTLLNFKIDRAQYTTYGLPVNGYSGTIPDYRQGLSRNANWPFGAVYVIVASKQVSRLTPIKPIWQRQRAFGRLNIVRPAVSNGVNRHTLRQDRHLAQPNKTAKPSKAAKPDEPD